MSHPGRTPVATRLVCGGAFLVDFLVAVAAIGGGLALTLGLEGDRFPRSWLVGTPFDSYVVPGMLLAVAVGGSTTVAAVAILVRPRLGGIVTAAAGVILAAGSSVRSSC